MWSLASKAVNRKIGLKNDLKNTSDCSDDEPSVRNRRDEALECPICWESFNIVENVPYVLWCGHTLCKNCVLGLQRAVVRLPTVPIQLPFFISCPWCNLLSLRLVYKGNLRFPKKNYFLLWMVESMNDDRSNACHAECSSSGRNLAVGNQSSHQISNRRAALHLFNQSTVNSEEGSRMNFRYINAERFQVSLRKSLVFFAHLTAKFPLIVIFLLIVLYAIPTSAAILALYTLITIVFALPSFLILYFALPSLDWLVREIIT